MKRYILSFSSKNSLYSKLSDESKDIINEIERNYTYITGLIPEFRKAFEGANGSLKVAYYQYMDYGYWIISNYGKEYGTTASDNRDATLYSSDDVPAYVDAMVNKTKDVVVQLCKSLKILLSMMIQVTNQ